MNLRSFKQSRIIRDDSGMYLMFFAGIFFAILAVVGLAVDVANIERTQVRLQAAVDSAVIGAASKYGTSWDDTPTIRETAHLLLNDNARKSGLLNARLDDRDLLVSAHDVAITRATADAPVLFLKMIPGLPRGFTAVTASALAEKPLIGITAVLDRSGSMTEPAGDGSGMTKFQKLIEATRLFVNSMDAGRTYFSIVSFSDTARVEVVMDRLDRNRASVDAALARMSAGGRTNIEDAMVKATTQMDLINSEVSNRAVLFLTDGAPTRDNNGSSGGCSLSDVRMRYFEAAIRASRVLRQHQAACSDDGDHSGEGSGDDDCSGAGHQVMFYTIGLGTEPHSYDPSDFYQNITDESNLRRYLLELITNSAGAIDDPAPTCAQSYHDYNDEHYTVAGQYFQTPSAADLNRIFLQIANLLRLRMRQ